MRKRVDGDGEKESFYQQTRQLTQSHINRFNAE
jgi:hypothetical protein